jgi:hypothetical protein
MSRGGGGQDWFFKLFGFRERNYDSTASELVTEEDADGSGLLIRSNANGASYRIGNFSTPSLGELMTKTQLRGGGSLKLGTVVGDVTAILRDSANRHATFQVASQFNCLEFASPDATPEEGIAIYAHDKTQGPACSIACGPATAYRNYCVEVEGRRGQRQDRQINNLADVCASVDPGGRLLKVTNGYVFANDSGLKTLNEALETKDEDEIDAIGQKLRIGVHSDVQVTSSNWGARLVEDPEQTVTQVFGSALSVAYSRNATHLWAPLARMVLNASYRATLHVGAEAKERHGDKDGSRRVFLTLLGGGVFGNELEWIVDAIRGACEEFREVDLEVIIVCYGGVPPEVEELCDEFGRNANCDLF